MLFSSSEEPSLRWLQDVWREAAEADADAQEVPSVQFAAVDTAVSPELAERFAVTAPAVLLFRQRQARIRKPGFCCSGLLTGRFASTCWTTGAWNMPSLSETLLMCPQT